MHRKLLALLATLVFVCTLPVATYAAEPASNLEIQNTNVAAANAALAAAIAAQDEPSPSPGASSTVTGDPETDAAIGDDLNDGLTSGVDIFGDTLNGIQEDVDSNVNTSFLEFLTNGLSWIPSGFWIPVIIMLAGAILSAVIKVMNG